MKNLQYFEDFVNERREDGMGLMQLKSAISKIEDKFKDKSSEMKSVKDDFIKGLSKKLMSVRMDSKEKSMVKKLISDLNKSPNISSIVDKVMSMKSKFGVKESFELVLEAETEKVLKGFFNILKKGAKLTWEQALKPLLKYLINVLSRLIVGIIYSLVNATFDKNYATPDSTIFKSKEADPEPALSLA